MILSFGPPPETAMAQTLLTEPISLPVIDQYFQRGGCTIAENKHTAGERVVSEYLPTYPAQTVNAFSEVLRLHRHQDPHLGSDLDHDPCPQKARIIPTGSRWGLRVKVIFIVAPEALLSSTTQLEEGAGKGNSTKCVGEG